MQEDRHFDLDLQSICSLKNGQKGKYYRSLNGTVESPGKSGSSEIGSPGSANAALITPTSNDSSISLPDLNNLSFQTTEDSSPEFCNHNRSNSDTLIDSKDFSSLQTLPFSEKADSNGTALKIVKQAVKASDVNEAAVVNVAASCDITSENNLQEKDCDDELTQSPGNASYLDVISIGTLSSIGNDFSSSPKKLPSGNVEAHMVGEQMFVEVDLTSQMSIEGSLSNTTEQEPVLKANSSFSSLKARFLSSPEKSRASPKSEKSPSRDSSIDGRRLAAEISSTTALILEARPSFLPAKSDAERKKHEEQYKLMVQNAKKRELQEAARKQKEQVVKLKEEERRAKALNVWTKQILCKWDSMRTAKKTRELWWQGIPPAVRGRVWQLALGNDLNLTSELYDICLGRARDRLRLRDEVSDTDSLSDISVNRESSVEQIRLDVSRTFPQLGIFQKGGPYHDMLHNVLAAYACYRPDVGYVQGMSFLSAVLLLNQEPGDAFVSLGNLLNQTVFRCFFRLEHAEMWPYFQAFEECLQHNLPKVYTHLKSHGIKPELYLIDWILTLYSKALPLDVASRVWDVFFRDGDEFLFRTAIGLMKLLSDQLLMLDFDLSVRLLTRLPETMNVDKLFKFIGSVNMNSGRNRTFQQLIVFYKQIKLQ